ncbi:MAG: LCP family protein [Anaerolineaceae bacterium]|nr:LCP family protein [Anaerolineaceae bacterium]
MKNKKFHQKNRLIISTCLSVLLTLSLALLLTSCNFPRAALVKMTPQAVSATPEVLEKLSPDQTLDPEAYSKFPEEAGDAPVLFTPVALEKDTQSEPGTNKGPTTAAGSEGVCGRSGSMTLLLLGIDEHSQADAIRVIRIDFDDGSVRLISIPRDFYIPIVGFENYGIRLGRINATFGYGEYFLGSGSGASSLAENLEYNFGILIDHTFVLHLQTIANYIDAIGGITVNLEKAASDPSNYFPAGENKMDGERAVAFMRIRQFDSDLARINRQTVVLGALLDKIRSGLSTGQIFRLISSLATEKSTQTDLTVSDMYMFYCLSGEISKTDIHVYEIPSSMFHNYTTPQGGAVLIPHQEVPAFLQESLGIE